MDFIDKLKQAENTSPLLSFEILPPIVGNGLNKTFSLLDQLVPLNPAFINITYHSRTSNNYSSSSNSLQPIEPTKKRPGTIGLCAVIKNRYNFETIPHIICTNHDKEKIEDDLIELHYLNITNVLALRGDKLKNEETFTPKKGGYHFAIDLVKQIKNMNEGNYLGGIKHSLDKSNFCIGVAGYPEKHFEAVDYDIDLKYLKDKVDAGADYIITQMFFNNQYFYDFVHNCRKIGIKVPIIPGIKNLTKRKQIDTISKIFSVEIPKELSDQFKNAQTPEQEEEVGRKWAIQQCLDLIQFKVPCLHFYTMGKITSLKKIINAIN